MSNHYDPGAYGPDGHLVDGATPRAMTSDERKAYGRRLLDEARPAPTPGPQPVEL